MAGLRDCPACTKPVSTQAPTCPHCGHPFQTIVAMPKTEGIFMQSLNAGCIVILVILAVLLFGFLLIAFKVEMSG